MDELRSADIWETYDQSNHNFDLKFQEGNCLDFQWKQLLF